ncbi:MAG: NAD(P)H-binding protein [Roseiflexaceae bacterium]
MTTDQQQLTLVLGGSTGKTGRRVAERLAARGVPLRIGSRTAELPFDWQDARTWAAALHGVASVYMAYVPDLAVPGAAAAIRAFTQLAVQSDVKRLVLLSGRGEEEAQICEQIVQTCGLEWTILRASWFAQNFSENFMRDLVVSGEVALPVGDVAEPFIDTEDIADVAVAALTDDTHVGQLYELTGPHLLTFAEAIRQIASATGRDIRYLPISYQEFASALAADGVPADVTALLTYLFTTVLDGRNAHLADGVQRALGREPRDFAAYVRHTAATGVWQA